ncbi:MULTISPECIES: tRNA-binding protein [Paraburkholderia]|uniref:tRNA-binding protein n=2 Tax=Paraburkholderia madseniana TaxID=2599607 RepID=A0AAP5BJA4_9BURK|nr:MULTISPECIES: tRNA-binding protein [Paraburkholderia]MCX4149762.1 tRNA-binding protein [Paraburkholderia madseniana]MDN7152698.1 tRNA-binding protein [Paraburkholderia sp. WS6]MDQ6411580.1 tRNA-binding protein [Paraburkholderia madseniana]NPT65076.1 tRNA-binding protein [Paraburkholderia madseniana]
MSEGSAYEAFNQVDLRVGKVVRVELNHEAKKPAYKLWIDFGELGERTTSAQYTELYQPEQLVGRSVVCAVNLGTRRIAGFKSEVLTLGVERSEGAVVYLTTERDVAPGTKVF